MMYFPVFALILSGAVANELYRSPEFDGYDVQQLHMAQGVDATSLTLDWVTGNPTATMVKYGLSQADMSSLVTGSSVTYSYNYSSNTYQSGYLHTAHLSGLQPRTTYFYQVGDFDRDITSGIHSFTTLPLPGDTTPLHFAVLGDLGMTTDSQSTLVHIASGRPNAILHVGDLSYANCDHKQWDSYGNMISPLSSEVVWMVGAGNHEIEYSSSTAGLFTAFEYRYHMPALKPAQFGEILYQPSQSCTPSEFQAVYDYGNSFYSFDMGMTHIINLNPYADTSEASNQYQWLVADLQAVDRDSTPWIIVMMHCPFYNSNSAHHNEYQTVAMLESMEEVLYKFRVNLIFAGHVHAYERTYPVFANATTAAGPIYINIGDGGNAEGHATGFYPQPSWSAFRNGTQYGHGELKVLNNTNVQWSWHRNVDGNVIVMDKLDICNSIYGDANCGM